MLPPWDHPRVPDGRTIYQVQDGQEAANARFVRLLYLGLAGFVCLLIYAASRLPWGW
jgi:hypothetical protein